MSKQVASDEKVVSINQAEFDSQVLGSNIPVFVDFYADWCGPCNMVAPTIEMLSAEYGGKVKFVKVNVDKNQQLAMKYDVMSIPTSILFEKGTPSGSLIGAYPASRYQQLIDRALAPGGLKTGKQ